MTNKRELIERVEAMIFAPPSPPVEELTDSEVDVMTDAYERATGDPRSHSCDEDDRLAMRAAFAKLPARFGGRG